MKMAPYISLIFRPRVVRAVAAESSDIVAVVVNAASGLFLVAAMSLQMLPLFTGSLAAFLTILFGPLAGFIVSSLYSRIELTVGGRLGGKASLDELYRLYAWSFIPAGFAALFYGLIIYTLKESSTATDIIASIPALFIFCCSLRNYCSNIIAVQQFTRTRGVLSIVLSFVLFLILIAGAAGCISLLYRYGMGETLKYILTGEL